MSNLSHPTIRRSERGPRADMDGGKDPSNGSNVQPHVMESHLTSSGTTTESQVTDSSDELTEAVAAETSPSVSGSPGVKMGVSGNAIPVPEVEPEAPEANICNCNKRSRLPNHFGDFSSAEWSAPVSIIHHKQQLKLVLTATCSRTSVSIISRYRHPRSEGGIVFSSVRLCVCLSVTR